MDTYDVFIGMQQFIYFSLFNGDKFNEGPLDSFCHVLTLHL